MNNSLRSHYFRILRQQKGMALLGVFLAVVTAYAGVALLAVSGWFISAAALAGLSAVAAHQFDFFSPGAMVRGFSIARTFGRYGERLSSHEATFRVVSHLRTDLFRFISQQRWQETQLNRHDSASRLMQDIQHIESIYLSALLPAVVALATTLGFVITLWLVVPDSLVLALPLLLLAVVVMPWLYSREVLASQNQLHTQRAEQWQRSSALLSNLRTLTLHGRLQQTGQQLVDQGQQADQQEARTVNLQQSLLLLANLSLIALTVWVFWQGFLAWQAGELIAANLFMLLLLSLGTADVLITASPVLAAWQLGMKALQRLGQEPVKRHDQRLFGPASSRFESDTARACVRLQAINYRYPSTSETLNPPVFEQFSHEFKQGQWCWITGSSGRGKSTLIHLLAGELQVQRGVIELLGVDAEDIGLMPQRIDILKAPLRDNLCLHQNVSDDDIWAALAMVELDDWARQLPNGLDTWMGDGEWQPSGGETKRIGLARLILRAPAMVLLDEPAAGMDAALAARIFARLASHWHNHLVIANTHDQGLIQDGQQVLEL
ncbi:amino acid ABC transporter ATP-binding/permease protein [Oceanobacter kriegii]|uniref:amino acid ABC transporter ATP-binding/permease protein n=1 Tax=Oceanobacter kriegii TaxID=64972 RepID=UPI00041B5FE7|nr:ATP-binding cassette domain-containing protein [Oceanobacter kriegii]